ncbi:MAG: DUF2141 domain-containing protein [Myxococcales bacterium]|nr:DUF2141 domain-containing protein [Myxococcales bacterium]
MFLRSSRDGFGWGIVLFGLVAWMGWQAWAKPTTKHKTAGRVGTIHIHIKGLRSNKGFVSITLFNSAKGYPMRPQHAVARLQLKLKSDKALFVFRDLPFGRYAAAAYHDENGNGKLDTNWIGIPREGTAASNDAKGFMGPPKFRDANFPLSRKSLTISMKMNY